MTLNQLIMIAREVPDLTELQKLLDELKELGEEKTKETIDQMQNYYPIVNWLYSVKMNVEGEDKELFDEVDRMLSLLGCEDDENIKLSDEAEKILKILKEGPDEN